MRSAYNKYIRKKGVHTDVVQGVENTEDVETILNGLAREVVDGVVPNPRLANTTTSHGHHDAYG